MSPPGREKGTPCPTQQAGLSNAATAPPASCVPVEGPSGPGEQAPSVSLGNGALTAGCRVGKAPSLTRAGGETARVNRTGVSFLRA